MGIVALALMTGPLFLRLLPAIAVGVFPSRVWITLWKAWEHF